MDKLLLDALSFALASRTATAVAAVVLCLVVWVLQKIPAVGKFFADKPIPLAIITAVFATVPAVVTSLMSSASVMDVVSTAVITFLGSLGLKSMLPAPAPVPEASA